MLTLGSYRNSCTVTVYCLTSAEEIASDFGNIVLGNNDTEHQILVPTLQVLSLSERTIKPLPEGTAPFTEAEAKALLRKVASSLSAHFLSTLLYLCCQVNINFIVWPSRLLSSMLSLFW